MTHVARSLRHDCLVQLNTRILAGDARAEELRQDNSYVCAYCEHEERVFFRCGDNVRAHFAHTAGTQCWVESHEDWGRESADHLLAKFWLCNQIHIETGFATQIEAVVGERERIADILVLAAQCDARVAIEIQLAPISVEKIIERTESYIRNNVDVIWIVGEKNIGLFNQVKKHKKLEVTNCKFYLIVFSEDEISICTLEKHNPHDPAPQRYMMMEILNFMLERAKTLANNGAELSCLLHGQEVDLVSYERYFNYNNDANRRVNPFDIIELNEKKSMRELFLKRREEEYKNNALKRIADKNNIEAEAARAVEYEKKKLAAKHIESISNNKFIQNDNAVVLQCQVVSKLKSYKSMAFIKVSVRDLKRSNDRGDWRFWIDIKAYNPFAIKALEKLESGDLIIIYGYIERVKRVNADWETHIIAEIVETTKH